MSDKEVIRFLEIIDIDLDCSNILPIFGCARDTNAIAVCILHGNSYVCATFDICLSVAFLETERLKC